MFLNMSLVTSPRDTGVVLIYCCICKQLVLSLLSKDRHAFSCLVAVRTFTFVYPAKRDSPSGSKVFAVVFKFIYFTDRQNSSSFVAGF